MLQSFLTWLLRDPFQQLAQFLWMRYSWPSFRSPKPLANSALDPETPRINLPVGWGVRSFCSALTWYVAGTPPHMVICVHTNVAPAHDATTSMSFWSRHDVCRLCPWCCKGCTVGGRPAPCVFLWHANEMRCHNFVFVWCLFVFLCFCLFVTFRGAELFSLLDQVAGFPWTVRGLMNVVSGSLLQRGSQHLPKTHWVGEM